MSRDTVPVRRLGPDSRLPMAWLVGIGCTLVLGLCLVLEIASWLDTGEPAPGGFNPITVDAMWLLHHPVWTGRHTAAAAGLLGLSLAGYLGVRLLRRKRRRKVRGDDTARYLGRAEAFSETAVRQHAEAADLTTGETVGLPVARVVSTRKWFWLGFRDGGIAEMGPGSGKTAAMVIPGALSAPGPVWVTSNRSDVAAALLTSREDRGPTWVFDPQQVAGMPPRFYYDPLSYIRAGLVRRVDRDGTERVLDLRDVRARELARQFAHSSRPPDAKTDAFFDPAGQALLANLMLAAAIENLPLTQVLDWASMPQNRRAQDILKQHAKVAGERRLAGVRDLVDTTRGSVYETAATIISFLQNDAARDWIERRPGDDRPEFRPEHFVRSDGDQMLCLSREGEGSFGPIVAAMTNATVHAAEDYAAECPGGRLPVPMVMQLDEVANVCRMTSLPDLVSHAGGRGILIVPYLQSPAQGRAAWGSEGWDKLFGASIGRFLGRGLIDVKHLEEMSKAIGERDVLRRTSSRSTGRNGSRTYAEQWTREPIMSVADLVHLPRWRAVVIASGERAALLELVPWWERPEMADRVRRSRQAFLDQHPELVADVETAEEQDVGAAPVAVDWVPLGEDVA